MDDVINLTQPAVDDHIGNNDKIPLTDSAPQHNKFLFDNPSRDDINGFPKDNISNKNKKASSLGGEGVAEKLKRIDFVLTYPVIDSNHDDSSAKKKHHRQDIEKMREKFESAMKTEGLKLQTDVYKNNMFVKVHTPFARLCMQAEKIKLEMPLIGCEIYEDTKDKYCISCINHFKTDDEVDFVSAPFIFDRLHLYEGHEKEDTFFRPSLRSYLTHQILINVDIREKSSISEEDHLTKKGLPYMLMKGVYANAIPLHEESIEDPLVIAIEEQKAELNCVKDVEMDVIPKRIIDPDPRKELNQTWTKFTKWQPFWKVRNYFGEKIALYFAWSGTLITSLWIPTLFGLAIFFYGLYLSIKRSHFASSTHPNTANVNQTSISQLVETFKDVLSVIKESFDNEITPYFALIICLWGTIFLELWKRKNATLAYEWDVDNFEISEPDRPEFVGTKTRPDPVTKEDSHYYPLNRKLIKFFVSASFVLLMILMVIISVVAVIVYRVFLDVDYCNSGKLSGIECLLASTICSSLLNAISILLLGKLYDFLAVKLTDWENHRTKTAYDDALIIKMFSFQFVNSYASCFYIAFFRSQDYWPSGILNAGSQYRDTCGTDNNCMSQLSFQVLVLMLMKPFPKLIKDIVLPFVKKMIRKCRKGGNKIQDLDTIDELNEYIERERLKPELGDFTLGEYTEKVIQYGYLMLFAASFPLAPLIALLTNLFDIRVDAKRLLWWYRRPVSFMAQDIGMWYALLTFVNVCGVVSNAFLIAFTASFGKQYDLAGKLALVLVFEHIVCGIALTMRFVIPDKSDQVQFCERREKWQVARIIEENVPPPRKYYTDEDGKLRRRRKKKKDHHHTEDGSPRKHRKHRKSGDEEGKRKKRGDKSMKTISALARAVPPLSDPFPNIVPASRDPVYEGSDEEYDHGAYNPRRGQCERNYSVRRMYSMMDNHPPLDPGDLPLEDKSKLKSLPKLETPPIAYFPVNNSRSASTLSPESGTVVDEESGEALTYSDGDDTSSLTREGRHSSQTTLL
ncbi:anoctamin-7-like isoform X3 [Tubulanus polymorphus]|uniref:anoctamin-7-like isoform X3 n=1 Tax=Tubulanus polymorphus TaxID=672921 RepID=UPI003DA3161D